jgi:hypothetical protein
MIYPLLSRSFPKSSNASPKDVLVILPFLGSALALSWEVGSFIPIGGGSFGLFSLSEHLLFAVQALPIALAFAGLLAVILTGLARSPKRYRLTRGANVRWALRAIVAFFFALGLIIFVVGLAIERSTMLATLGIGVIGFSVAFAIYPPVVVLWPIQFGIFLSVLALAFAVAVGVDSTRGQLNIPSPVELTLDGKAKEVVVVRSGERGLLLCDPLTQKFSFAKWEAVKGFDWSRRPMLSVKK